MKEIKVFSTDDYQLLESDLNKIGSDFSVLSHVVSDGVNTLIIRIERLDEATNDYVKCQATMQNLPGLPGCTLIWGHEGDCVFR